eukprot:5878968-Pleurochrysis_carterae.AAC.1
MLLLLPTIAAALFPVGSQCPVTTRVLEQCPEAISLALAGGARLPCNFCQWRLAPFMTCHSALMKPLSLSTKL